MALIAALLTDPEDRQALLETTEGHEARFTDSWHGLADLIRHEPIALGIADPSAEPRKDGVLRIYRLHTSFPLTPILAWGELDGRGLYRLGKAGIADLVLAHEAENRELVREIIHNSLSTALPYLIESGLQGQLQGPALDLARHAVHHIPNRIQVPELATAFGASVSTLERRCDRYGIPTPGRLILWLRVLYGLYWLAEPGRSLESIAGQLGYSSGAAFRRAIQATSGARGLPPRTYRSFHAALTRFLRECPGRAPTQPQTIHQVAV